MIKLNVVCGDGLRQEFVSPNAIARISQTGASSQWHGIRSVVRTFDGKNLECAETASEVAAAVDRPIVAPVAELAACKKEIDVERSSRRMFVSRIENCGTTPMTGEEVLALLNDCDMLAQLERKLI